MTRKEYNGWTNYETWAVALWLDNERGSHDYWLEQARELRERTEPKEHFTSDEQAQISLSEMLKSEHEAALPELQGFAADLLNAAMSEVDWYEIAKHFVEGAKEQAALARAVCKPPDARRRGIMTRWKAYWIMRGVESCLVKIGHEDAQLLVTAIVDEFEREQAR